MNKTLLIFSSLIFLNAACTTTSTCEEEAKTPTITTVTTATNAKDADGLPLRKVSMEWKAVDAKTVLMALFDEAEVKYKFSPNLAKQSVTAKVQDMDWRDALNQVTASAGYDYMIKDGTVIVKNAPRKKAPSKAAKKTNSI